MLPNQDALTRSTTFPDCRRRAGERAASYPPPRQELFRSPTAEARLGPGGRAVAPTSGVFPMAEGGEHAHSAILRLRAAGDTSPSSGLEYFIVRHLAVLTMHPMVESEFTRGAAWFD